MIETKGYFRFLSFLPKVLLAIIIPILDNIYNEVALWLNDMGNVFCDLCFYAISNGINLQKGSLITHVNCNVYISEKLAQEKKLFNLY